MTPDVQPQCECNWFARNQLNLPVQRGDPESVNHIGAGEFNVRWLSRGNVNFICGYELAARFSAEVMHFPPPLMTNDLYVGMRVYMIAAVQREFGHALECVNKQAAENHQRDGEAADQHPGLSAALIIRFMSIERAAPAESSP